MLLVRHAIRPGHPLRVNRSSPHALGLTHCFARYQGQLYDVLAQNSGGLTVPNTIVATPHVGMACTFAAGNSIALNLSGDATLGARPCTWVSWLYPTALGADHDSATWWSSGKDTSFYGWYASVGAGHANIYTDGAGSWLDGTDPITVNQWNMAAFALDTSYRAVSANGRPKQTDSLSSVPRPEVDTIYYGRRVDGLGGAPSFIGYLAELRRYNRVLTDAELRSLYDPLTRWDLYTVPLRLPIDVPAAAGGVTGWGPLLDLSRNRLVA